MAQKWKTLNSEIILRTPGVDVWRDCVELQNGNTIDYYVFEIREWASIVPITGDGKLVLVEQYRHACGGITLEFPAGLVDSRDPSPLDTAKRELLEETGYTSEDWTFLGTFQLGPSKIRNAFHLYCARNCQPAAAQNLDDTEDIRVLTVTVEEFQQLFDEGKISDVDSALGWLLCRSRGLLTVHQPS
ncbi:MAG TPA: NUDIX hydrolase [bacterium]|nr:NUDIX hydrolase [bacterium]